jgi:trimethylamine--corrinoid protein Co-methyltransferase
VAGVHLLQACGIVEDRRQLLGVEGQFGFAQPQLGQFGYVAHILLDRIIDEARTILATVGMEIRGTTMHQRLLDAGLPATEDGRILFPAAVIDRALATAPATFTLFDRDGKPHAEIGGDHVHFTPGSSGLKVQDHRTGYVRAATTADFVEYVRLADGLEHIRYPATAFSTGDDIEADVADAWRLLLCLTNSRPGRLRRVHRARRPRMVEMMQLFRRDRADLIARPLSIFTITATGNFRYSEDSCQNLIDCVEAGIPVEIVPVTLMGLIAPVTLVGAAVFHAVDTLAGVVMAQIVRPGAPVLYGGAPAEFHMRETTSPMLGVQALRLDVLNAQVGRRLGLPVQAYMALSDAKSLTPRPAPRALAARCWRRWRASTPCRGRGCSTSCSSSACPSWSSTTICAGRRCTWRGHCRSSTTCRPALVAAQLAEMHLITAPHTLAHWEQQLYLPGAVYDRKNREAWQRAGSKTLWQRAVEEVEQRLAAYTPVVTDAHAVAEMERILRSGMNGRRTAAGDPRAGAAGDAAGDGRRQRRFRR